MDLTQAMEVAAAGMKVQGARLRLVANADSSALRPGASRIAGRPSRSPTGSTASWGSSG